MIRGVNLASATVLVTISGFLLNEWIGPRLIFVSMAMWVVVGARRIAPLTSTLVTLGPIPWLMPLLSLASVQWSPIPDFSLRLALESILTVFLTLFCVRMVRPREFLNIFWLVSMGVVLLSVVANGHQYDGDTGRIEATGIFQNKNTLAYVAASLMLSSISVVFQKERKGPTRILAGLMILLGTGMAVRAHSIAVDAVMAAAALVSLGFQITAGFPKRTRTFFAKLMVTLVLIGLVGAYLVSTTFSAELLTAVGKSPTLTGRTDLWHYAAIFYRSNPLLGRGFGGFWFQGQPQAEFLWKLEHIENRGGFHFHSIFWEELIELGEVGVALATITILAVAYRVIRWTTSDPSPVSGFYLAMTIFILTLQTQAVDLFGAFGPYNALFLLSYGYAMTYRRWAPAAAAPAPVSLTRIHAAASLY